MPTRHGTAVVAEVGWVNGLAAIRSLGRRGLRVLAVDHRPWALGYRSRYAEPALAPEPVVDEQGFVLALRALAEQTDEGPLPIFPTHDEHLNAIARNVDTLGDSYLFPFPSWQTLERIQSKRYQLEQADAIGMPTPRTHHPRSVEEARAAGEDLGYPVFVKPSDPILFKQAHNRQAFRCETWSELESAYALAAEHEPMVQEFVPGGDDELYTLGSYLNRDGEALGLFCGRKLRQTRDFMGSARVGEALWVNEVVDDGLRLLRALDFHGVSQVEVKRDPRDGRYKLIEVNPRLWQWHGLASACGVDLPWIAYQDLTGDPPPPARMNGNGKIWAITIMAGSTNAVQRPPYVDAVFAIDDPLPTLVQFSRFGRRGLRRLGLKDGRPAGSGSNVKTEVPPVPSSPNVLQRLKPLVPVSVKRPLRRALPRKYHRYFDPDWHRRTIGNVPLWDHMGKLQFDYLVDHGLKPDHYLLDVGCGPLRGGVHFIQYLEEGHYYGVDKRGDVIEEARELELPRHGLAGKRPTLRAMERFEFPDLGQTFDYAIAQSVFTHLPLNSVTRCLINMGQALKPGGQFYATVYENPRGKLFVEDIDQTERVVSHYDFDYYHYDLDTLRWACEGTGLEMEFLGDWDNPQNQKMILFRKSNGTNG
jgi:D-aspartate ligase